MITNKKDLQKALSKPSPAASTLIGELCSCWNPFLRVSGFSGLFDKVFLINFFSGSNFSSVFHQSNINKTIQIVLLQMQAPHLKLRRIHRMCHLQTPDLSANFLSECRRTRTPRIQPPQNGYSTLIGLQQYDWRFMKSY